MNKQLDFSEPYKMKTELVNAKATVGTLIPPVGAYQHDRNNIVRAANTLLGSKSTKERKKWESELMARAGKNPSAAVWNLRRRAELMHKVDDGSWIRYQQLADKIENKLMVVKNR